MKPRMLAGRLYKKISFIKNSFNLSLLFFVMFYVSSGSVALYRNTARFASEDCRIVPFLQSSSPIASVYYLGGNCSFNIPYQEEPKTVRIWLLRQQGVHHLKFSTLLAAQSKPLESENKRFMRHCSSIYRLCVAMTAFQESKTKLRKVEIAPSPFRNS